MSGDGLQREPFPYKKILVRSGGNHLVDSGYLFFAPVYGVMQGFVFLSDVHRHPVFLSLVNGAKIDFLLKMTPLIFVILRIRVINDAKPAHQAVGCHIRLQPVSAIAGRAIPAGTIVVVAPLEHDAVIQFHIDAGVFSHASAVLATADGLDFPHVFRVCHFVPSGYG
jgi:hypothetical protein